MRHVDHKTVIGWREKVALPEWGIESIEAKADTGARSSAVDVKNLRELPGNIAAFEVALSRRDRERTVHVEAPIVRRTRVRSSNGQVQERLFAAATVRIGDVTKTVELSLVCRQRMICRMLLGRSALEEDFVVDVAERYLASPRARKRLKKRLRQKTGSESISKKRTTKKRSAKRRSGKKMT